MQNNYITISKKEFQNNYSDPYQRVRRVGLKSIRKETIEICGATSHATSSPSVEQQRILQLLEVRI